MVAILSGSRKFWQSLGRGENTQSSSTVTKANVEEVLFMTANQGEALSTD